MKIINAALLALAAPLASAGVTPLNDGADALIAVSVGAVGPTMTYTPSTNKMSLDTGGSNSTANAAGAAALAAAVGSTLTVSAPKIILTLHGSLDVGTWGEHFEDPATAECVITDKNTIAAIGETDGSDVDVYGSTTTSGDITTFDELMFLQDNDLRGFFGSLDDKTTAGDDFDLVTTCSQRAITATTDGRINLCITAVTTLDDSTGSGHTGTEISTYEDFLGGDGDGYHFMEQNCMELTFTESIDGIDFELEVSPVDHTVIEVSTEIVHTPQLKVTLCTTESADVNLGESFCLNADVYGLPEMYWWTCHRTEAAGMMSIADGDSKTGESHCDNNFHVEVSGSDSNEAIVAGGECSINAALAGAGEDSTCDARTLYYQPSQTAASGGTAAATATLNDEAFRFRVSLIVRLPVVLDHALSGDEGIDVNVVFDAGAWTTTASGSLD